MLVQQIQPTTLPPTELRYRRLPPSIAFGLQASIVMSFLAGSSAPTPLYAIYQSAWGFSAVMITVIFGVYALAVLISLLTVGSLSDHIGRRPVLLVALALQILTMIIFMTADSVPGLIFGRVVQGLSTGGAVGAIGAGMLDLNREKGTIAGAVAPMAGTAAGGLLAGLLVQFLPAPTHLIYLVLLGVFVLQGIGVLLMKESATTKPGAWASLRPQFGLPKAARSALVMTVPVIFAVWALVGFYGSLGPTLVRQITGSNSVVLGGLTLFVMAASGGLTVLVLRRLTPHRMLRLGASALVVGVSITLLAMGVSSTAIFFAGTAIAGAGFGAGFQGALRVVLPLTHAHEKAGVLSALYIVSYLAMGLPAVIAGILVVDGGGLMVTAREYSVGVIILAAIALVAALRAQQETPESGRQLKN